MLHDASGPTWAQTCYLPAAGAELERSELAITVLGRFASRGGFDLTQTPRQVSFHVVHAGEGTVSAGGTSWRAARGSVFTFVPGVPVHYQDRPDRPWRYSWCILVGTRALEVARRLGGCDGSWSRDDLPVAQVIPVLDAMEAAFRSEDHSPYFAQTAAWRFCDALCPRGTDADRSALLATAIRRILEEQFSLPLKLGSLAHQLGVDRSTVFRRFQSLYGCSPKAYLDRMRLEHAVALLRAGGISIADVAERCGFAGAQRFAKAFRARYGMAPSLYRDEGGTPG